MNIFCGHVLKHVECAIPAPEKTHTMGPGLSVMVGNYATVYRDMMVWTEIIVLCFCLNHLCNLCKVIDVFYCVSDNTIQHQAKPKVFLNVFYFVALKFAGLPLSDDHILTKYDYAKSSFPIKTINPRYRP
jgi:hypothetical protein